MTRTIENPVTGERIEFRERTAEGRNPRNEVFTRSDSRPTSAKRFLEENATVGGSFVGGRIESLLASLGPVAEKTTTDRR